MNARYQAAATATILIGLAFLVRQATAARPCDENGQCKYGGWCEKQTNTCLCSFRCSKELWGNEWHCTTAQKNGRRKYFANLCLVRAHACERQEEVPIMKIDFTDPESIKCRGIQEEPVRLCPQAEDFHGRCGSSNGRGGNTNAGICLQHRSSSATSCRCPSDTFGMNCESRKISVRSVIGQNSEGEMGLEELAPREEPQYASRQTQIAVFVAAACLAAVICVVLFVRRRKSNRQHPLNDETIDNEIQTTTTMAAKARTVPYSDSAIRVEPERHSSSTQQRRLAAEIRDAKPVTSSINSRSDNCLQLRRFEIEEANSNNNNNTNSVSMPQDASFVFVESNLENKKIRRGAVSL